MNSEERLLKLDLPTFANDVIFNIDNTQKFYAEHTELKNKILNKYYSNWINHIFIDKATRQINIEIINIKKGLVNNITNQSNNIQIPIKIRFLNVRIALNALRLNKTDYICNVFSIKKTFNNFKTNYLYLYSSVNGSNITHDYFCFGINLLSSDGEYRSRFVNFQVLENMRNYRTELWREVENYLSSKPNMHFQISQYSSKKHPKHVLSRLKSEIMAKKYTLKFYVLSWLTQGLIKYLNVQNSHIDPHYNKNIFNKGDMKFMASLIEKYSIKTLRTFYTSSSSLYTDYANMDKYKSICGQKIIPISMEAANNLFNIKYDPWLEYYINEKLNKLVMNSVSPSFPLTYDWFFIYGVNTFLFDNKQMVNKMELSDNARDIVSQLEKARKTIYYNMDMRSEIKKHLHSQGSYDEKELILSDIGIVILSEYVGRTINDITASMRSSQYKKDIGSIFSVNAKFFKYMFDIIYSLSCMNKRLNVIHGDLHLNNTTLRHVDIPYLSSMDWTNMHSAYVIDKECYIFEYNNMIGTIIDFSRGFIIPEESSLMKVVKERISQRILAYYENLFPIFMSTYRNKLKAALITNFMLIYKVFTAIDPFIHCGRLQDFIKNNPILGATGKVLVLIKNIFNMAKSFLEQTMIQIIKGKIKTLEYPNITILKKYFKPYVANLKKINNSNIISIYNSDNSLQYSLSAFDNFHPYFKRMGLKKGANIHYADGVLFKTTKIYKRFESIRKYYEEREKQINNLLLD